MLFGPDSKMAYFLQHQQTKCSCSQERNNDSWVWHHYQKSRDFFIETQPKWTLKLNAIDSIETLSLKSAFISLQWDTVVCKSTLLKVQCHSIRNTQPSNCKAEQERWHLLLNKCCFFKSISINLVSDLIKRLQCFCQSSVVSLRGGSYACVCVWEISLQALAL